jgi:two-component system cell cycle sensor histidine kinase PleC
VLRLGAQKKGKPRGRIVLAAARAFSGANNQHDRPTFGVRMPGLADQAQFGMDAIDTPLEAQNTTADQTNTKGPIDWRVKLVVWLAIAGVMLFALLAVKRIDQEQKSAYQRVMVEQSQTAALLASKLDGQMATLKVVLEAAANGINTDTADQNKRVQQALATSNGLAGGVALVTPRAVLAKAGKVRDAQFRLAARAARMADESVWVGAPDEDGAPWVYTAIPVKFSDGTAWLIAASDAGRFLPTPRPGQRVVVTTERGLVLGLSAAEPIDNARDLQAVMGIGGRLSLTREPMSGRSETPDKTILYVALAPAADGALAVVSGLEAKAFEQAWRLALAKEMFITLGPLMLAALLAAFLWRQAQNAELAKLAWGDSERRFRAAVEAARAGVWEWDFTRNRIYLSDALGAILGLRAGSYPSSTFLERIAPEDRDRVEAALRSARTYGAFDASFRALTPKGRYAWLDARGQAMGQETDHGHSALIGVALDVTEEKLASARAEAAETRLRDAIESVPEAFAHWDQRGRLVIANERLSAFFGLDPKLLRPGTDHQTLIDAMAAAVVRATGLEDGGRELELSTGRWVRWYERKTSDGGSVGVGADITDLRREMDERLKRETDLEQAFGELQKREVALKEMAAKYEEEKIRAEDASRAKSEFLANMSHELRTPLNAINGFSEIMVQQLFGPLGDPRYIDYSKDILNSGQHLLSLINDILDMSKIEARKMNLRMEALYPDEIAQDTIRLMRHRAEEAGIKLIADFGGLPEVTGDYRALKQILLNLLSNAVKFTPQGGKVVLSGRVIRDYVVISVTDTGIGIAKDDIGKLAKPFAQIESQHSKTFQGTGLGLALSKSLIELHGGTLQIDSELGRGTVVSFTLPVRQSKTEEQPIRRAI